MMLLGCYEKKKKCFGCHDTNHMMRERSDVNIACCASA